MRELIDRGHLTDYKIFAPKVADLHLNDDMRGSTGDYSKPKMVKATRASQIIGDVVSHYLLHAKGKRGITFVTDTQTADEMAAAYNAAGVPAEAIDYRTKDRDRAAAIKKLKSGKLLQLVNVDLFGEGFDLPAIEVVSFARPTLSYGLFVQQFGRALRLLAGKQFAIIIDHVGNVDRHGLPDADRVWSLTHTGRDATTQAAVSMVRVCDNCTGAYSRVKNICPYCGNIWQPAERSGPSHVDGDLIELDAETLASMRAGVKRADRTVAEVKLDALSRSVPPIGIRAAMGRQRELLHVQSELRAAMGIWSGLRALSGMDPRESQREFYLTFGVDVLTARSLETKQATALRQQIKNNIDRE